MVVNETQQMSSPGSIRAVIFDKDGTLFEFTETWSRYCDGMLDLTAGYDLRLRGELAASCGYDPVARSFQPRSPVVGGTIEEICRLWSAHSSRFDLPELMNLSARVISELRPEPIGDLPRLLSGLRKSGLLLGLVTNDLEAAARQQLDYAGVLGEFAFVCGSDSGHRPKPDADTILAFCRATGIAPAALAVVGDSLHDLKAARAGGAGLAIGVLTGPAGYGDLAPYADHILDTVMDLPLLLGRDTTA